MKTYSGLHCHSSYSLDGHGSITQYVKAAKEKGLYGLAITDHGDTSSILELKEIAKKESFPVASGCEFYLINALGDKTYYHLTVLAKNFEGYKNLCRLSTISTHKESEAGPHNHFYRKPRITFDEFFQHKEGLVVLSGCLAGPLSKEILNNDYDKANDFVNRFKQELGEDYYLELQPSVVMKEGFSGNQQEFVNRKVLEYYQSLKIPIVLTPDAHMPFEHQKTLQKIKMAARSSSKNVWEFDGEYHLFTADEFKQKVHIYHDYLDGLLVECFENSNRIIDLCQYDMPKFDALLPTYEIKEHPLYSEGDDLEKLAIKIVFNNNRLDFNNCIYVDRLKYELDVIVRNGKIDFLPYFLVLEDVIRWAKNNNIVLGPGRGSAAGSLLSYGLGLTHLDPIKFNLPFERFINKGRIINGSYPDIDLDFSDSSRIKQYVTEKYGEDKVALLGVKQTTKTQGAIKDVLTALRPEMTFIEKNTLTKEWVSCPQGINELDYFHEELPKHPTLKDFLDKNEDVLNATIELLGQTRQRGIHPCATVISPIPIRDFVPLWHDNGRWVTQFDQNYVEKSGLIKFDFLSLNTLNDISGCIKLIKKTKNLDIDPYNLPLDDSNVMTYFSRGDTHTVFQYHTSIPIRLLKEMKASSMNDLSAVTSLGRPGPMDVGMDMAYVRRKNGEEKIIYPHKALEEILKETYGVFCYQEQVSEAVKILGGFTLEEADEVRRAMGKKKPELIKSYKDKFIQYASDNYEDIDLEKASKIWDLIESFAGYGFNKSHSMSYAMIGYICQFLRIYFPLEWYCSVLSNGSKDDRKEVYPYIKEHFVLPDINLSREEFYIKDDKIIASIDFIEGIGQRTTSEIIQKQPFFSFDDFLQRTNKRAIKKDVMLALIYSGTFDSIEPNVAKNELVVRYFQFMKNKKGVPDDLKNLDDITLLRKRHEYLPIGELNYEEIFKDKLKGAVDNFNYILNRAPKDKHVSIVGRVNNCFVRKTKKEHDYAFIEMSNSGQKLKVIAWPETWSLAKEVFEKDNILQLFGKVNIYNDSVSVVCSDLLVLDFNEKRKKLMNNQED